MARFNVEKYDPRADSTLGFKDLAASSGCLVLNTKTREVEVPAKAEGEQSTKRTIVGCPCGCEGFPEGKRGTFLIGHDARLKGKLIRAHLANVQVIRATNGEAGEPETAEAVATFYGDHFAEALTVSQKAHEGREAKREARKAEIAQRAEARKAEQAEKVAKREAEKAAKAEAREAEKQAKAEARAAAKAEKEAEKAAKEAAKASGEVELKVGRNWFPGKIVATNDDGSVNVEYVNGQGTETLVEGVTKAKIRQLQAA